MSSVPASQRETSNIEYVYNASRLFSYTLDCVMKLPKRWMFLLSERTVDSAAHLLEHAKSANSIYVSCALDANLRRFHLVQAYCAAQVLSSYVDEIYERFPARATEGQKPRIGQSAYLAWVESIDKEFRLLKGVMQSDKKRFAHYFEGKENEKAWQEATQLGLFDA